jgi:hypothetical protein
MSKPTGMSSPENNYFLCQQVKGKKQKRRNCGTDKKQ